MWFSYYFLLVQRNVWDGIWGFHLMCYDWFVMMNTLLDICKLWKWFILWELVMCCVYKVQNYDFFYYVVYYLRFQIYYFLKWSKLQKLK